MSGRTKAEFPNFFEMLRNWLISLPTDLKILVEMMGDGGLRLEARALAVGTLFYILNPLGIIPDKIPVLGYVDDVIILRIAVTMIEKIDPDRMPYYRDKYLQIFQMPEQQSELLAQMLGALYSWLRVLVERLRERRFRKHTVEEVIASEKLQEEIFDEAMEYAASVDVNPEAIEQVLLATPPQRIVELLSSGLEGEQKRQIQQQEETIAERLTPAAAGFRKLLGRGQ